VLARARRDAVVHAQSIGAGRAWSAWRATLAGVIDHVTIRVPDLAEAGAFYERVFELLAFTAEPVADADFREWSDFSIARSTTDRPATRGLHVGLAARSHDQIDRWWRALTDAGYASDGAPGPRPEYSPGYYGAFVLEPDGHNVEAVFHDRSP
jgi:catechol 2,3-dioxygenase-like lactoylglutathione lyase family enzyme